MRLALGVGLASGAAVLAWQCRDPQFRADLRTVPADLGDFAWFLVNVARDTVTDCRHPDWRLSA